MKNEITTIVEIVNKLANTSGNVFEFDVTELYTLAEKSKAITSFEDANFKEVKRDMIKKRNYIKDYCLSARRDIKKVAEGVSDVEKTLYDIFLPEERRLDEIAEKEKEKKLREERLAVLPERRAKLATIDESINPDDDFLLAMDSTQFAEYVNDCVATKNENARLEIEREQARIRAEQDAIEREKEAQIRDKKAREEAQAEAERQLKIAKEEAELRVQREKEDGERKVKEERERIEQEAKDKAEQEIKERAELEAKEKADKEALEKKKKYQKWLADGGYTEDKKSDYHFTDNGVEIRMYKLVSVFKK